MSFVHAGLGRCSTATNHRNDEL